MFVKSPHKVFTFEPFFLAYSAINSKPFSFDFVVKVKDIFFDASFLIVAAPIPDAAPVTSIDFINGFIFNIFFSYYIISHINK